jgi:hypothetical protein
MLPDIAFLMKVYKLWLFSRKSLVSFGRTSISSYFDKLLDVNTFGVRDINPVFQVLLGILLNNPTYKGSRESWWPVLTGWSFRVYRCIVNTVLPPRDVNLNRVGLLFLGCNSVQSGSLLPTFWMQEVHSKCVNELPSKLSNNLSDYTTCN